MKKDLIIFNNSMHPPSKRRKTDKYFVFNNGDVNRNEFPLPSFLEEEIINSLENRKYGYSSPVGCHYVRRKIAFYEKIRSNNSTISQKNISITASATNGLDLSIEALKNDKRKEILIPKTSYPVSRGISRHHGFNIKEIPTKRENNFLPKCEDISELITNNTRAIVLTSPNNPTGTEYSSKEISKILEICKKHDVYLILDEIFSGLMLNKNIHSIPDYNIEEDKLIRINGWSKDRGVAGFRVGYIIAPSEITETIKNRINISYGNPPTLFNNFISKEITHRRYLIDSEKIQLNIQETFNEYRETILGNLKKYEENEKIIKDILSSINNVLDFTETQGGFIKFIKFDTGKMSDIHFAKSLYENSGAMLVPGSGFNTSEKGWMRMSFSQPKIVVEEGLISIKKYCEK